MNKKHKEKPKRVSIFGKDKFGNLIIDTDSLNDLFIKRQNSIISSHKKTNSISNISTISPIVSNIGEKKLEYDEKKRYVQDIVTFDKKYEIEKKKINFDKINLKNEILKYKPNTDRIQKLGRVQDFYNIYNDKKHNKYNNGYFNLLFSLLNKKEKNYTLIRKTLRKSLIDNNKNSSNIEDDDLFSKKINRIYHNILKNDASLSNKKFKSLNKNNSVGNMINITPFSSNFSGNNLFNKSNSTKNINNEFINVNNNEILSYKKRDKILNNKYHYNHLLFNNYKKDLSTKYIKPKDSSLNMNNINEIFNNEYYFNMSEKLINNYPKMFINLNNKNLFTTNRKSNNSIKLRNLEVSSFHIDSNKKLELFPSSHSVKVIKKYKLLRNRNIFT